MGVRYQSKMHIDLELRDPAKPSKLKECSLTSRKDFYQLVHPDDRQRVLTEAFDKLVKGEIKGYTAQYRRLFRNEYIWVKAFVQPYKYDENGKRYLRETNISKDKEIDFTKKFMECYIKDNNLYNLMKKYNNIKIVKPSKRRKKLSRNKSDLRKNIFVR